MVVQGLDKEREGGAVLQAAGAQGAPDACAPLLSALAARALGASAVLDDEADRLLGAVVGGLHARVFQERKVLPAMVAEALGHGLGCEALRRAACDTEDPVA